VLLKKAARLVAAAKSQACHAGIVEHDSKKPIRNVSKIG
jgi:hypothetical protein